MTNNVEDKKHNILELNLKQDECYNVEAKGAKFQVGVIMSQLKSTNLQRIKMRRQYQHLAQLCQMQFFTTLIKSKKSLDFMMIKKGCLHIYTMKFKTV